MSEPQADNLLARFGQASGAWVWDARAGRLFADARFAGLTGLDPAAVAAGAPTDAFFRGIHEEDRLRIRIAVAGVLRGAEIFAKEFRVRGADGVVRWVSGRGLGEQDASGALVRFTGLLSDITEQKRVEEQLRVAQTAGGVGAFEHVDGFGTASVSEQFCRLLGLHPADALPVRTINSVVQPGDPLLIRIAGPSDDTGGYCELRIRRADTGEERWIARRGEHLADEAGHGARFVGVIYDITAAKQSESMLRELAQTLEARVEERTRERDRVWNSARDLFVAVSPDGVYRAGNPAWGKLLGYREDEIVGRRYDGMVHPEDVANASSAFERLLRGEAVDNLDIRMRRADGGYQWITWSVVPEDGMIYGVGRDVTERKQLEDQLRQSQKMEAVGQLTGGLAHDFNNMLTGIIGGLDLARGRIQSGRYEDAFRFMDAAIASAQRAAALTHRLLAFSRRQSLDPQALDVGDLIHSMEDLLHRTLGEQIDVAVIAPADLWRARADANQLESAILNLAINARDAMPSGGKLTVECANLALGRAHTGESEHLEPGDYVVIGVSDTGAGMPENVRAKVFEPFFTTKPIGQGTGLGLSMVYGFVRQSGGHVGIYSEPGVGTTVRLYLPRLPHEAADSAPEVRSEAPIQAGSGETVLVVEDDPQVRMLVGAVLRDVGYSAIEACDGAAALRYLEGDDEIRLMITDVGLPGLNGRQLAEIVRQRRPGLPVLFVTGYAPNAAIRGDFLAEGMRMISKPFGLEALTATLREMLGA